MFGKFEKVEASWPKTKTINNGAGVHITGKYLPPAFVQPVQGVYIIGAAIVVFTIAGKAGSENTLTNMLVPIVVAIILYPLWMRAATQIVGKSVDIKVTSDSIQVKKLFGYKNYSRDMRLEFRVDQHQKGVKERAKEIETGKKQSTTYRRAVEVVMQYGEHRVVLAELPEKDTEKAKALVIRLGELHDSFRGQVANEELSQKMGQYISAPAAAGDFGRAPDIR